MERRHLAGNEREAFEWYTDYADKTDQIGQNKSA